MLAQFLLFSESDDLLLNGEIARGIEDRIKRDSIKRKDRAATAKFYATCDDDSRCGFNAIPIQLPLLRWFGALLQESSVVGRQ